MVNPLLLQLGPQSGAIVSRPGQWRPVVDDGTLADPETLNPNRIPWGSQHRYGTCGKWYVYIYNMIYGKINSINTYIQMYIKEYSHWFTSFPHGDFPLHEASGMCRNYSYWFTCITQGDFPLHAASGMCTNLHHNIQKNLDAANAGGCDMKRELIPAQVAKWAWTRMCNIICLNNMVPHKWMACSKMQSDQIIFNWKGSNSLSLVFFCWDWWILSHQRATCSNGGAWGCAPLRIKFSDGCSAGLKATSTACFQCEMAMAEDDIHTYIHADRQAERQKERQTDRHTDRHTDIHRYIHIGR